MTSSTSCKTLFNCRFPHPEATIRLFCFPWAGGGSNFYAAWGKDFPPHIEVHGITLGGRETRFKDVPSSSAVETVSDIAQAIAADFSNKPFIFFGHSMGALLSYETAVLLRKQHGLQPAHMYLSGASAPHSPSRHQSAKDLSGLTEEEFLQHLKSLGGTPAEILANEELMQLFLPALKADYAIASQIVCERVEGQASDLTCSFTFFDGMDDNDHAYDYWKQLTCGTFSSHRLPGGHFYLKDKDNLELIISEICQDFPGV